MFGEKYKTIIEGTALNCEHQQIA